VAADPPPEDILVAKAIEDFVEAAENGRARNRSGRAYRPSALRDLRGSLRYQAARDIGDLRLADVRRHHVQALVDRLAADQLSESRIRSVVSAVRALYGYAIEQGYVDMSPADALVIPRDDERGRGWDERGPPIRARVRFGEDERGWSSPDVDEMWRDPGRRSYDRVRGARRGPEPEPVPRERSRGDFQPMALLPERILSLVLRIVMVVFVLFALVMIAESV
jgi:hypothetical protein